jgi:hypothetical protein
MQWERLSDTDTTSCEPLLMRCVHKTEYLLSTASEETPPKQGLDRAPILLKGTFGIWTVATQKTRLAVMVGPFLGASLDGTITAVVRLLIPGYCSGSNRNLVYTVTTYIAYWTAVNVALVRMMIKEVRYFRNDI